MKKLPILLLALCLLLSGCTGWMDGSYHSSSLYQDEGYEAPQQSISVSNYIQLRQALAELVEAGQESGIITGQGLDEDFFEENMSRAINYVMTENPIGAYAVESIHYEAGTSGGVQAVSVSITYNHNQTQIRRMKSCQDMAAAMDMITQALENCEAGVVFRALGYEQLDIQQLLRDFADDNPHLVMEMPQVTVSTYPVGGEDRVVEVLFTYQTSRETLRSMQEYVTPVFTAAAMYVRGDTEQSVKYTQMYSFLMERFPYVQQSSITPTYSLLRYGVGDSKAFAQVYAAMCRRAELECLVVSGTYAGESRFWNMVCIDGVYAHVDLLACNEAGEFRGCTDEEMVDYVWDYSAYPACVDAPEISNTP